MEKRGAGCFIFFQTSGVTMCNLFKNTYENTYERPEIPSLTEILLN